MAHVEHSRMIVQSRTQRYGLLVCGWSNVTLGMIGALVPGMPTTVFLIVAFWAFTRSSPRMSAWLYNHRRFGKTLQAWDRYRVIPPRAKFLAVAMMTVSLVIITIATSGWTLPVVVGAVMLAVSVFILTRPSHAPVESVANT